MTIIAAPIPIPAFAPEESPEFTAGERVEVGEDEGAEVCNGAVRSVLWKFSCIRGA